MEGTVQGVEGFVSTLGEQLSAGSIWGAIAPMAAIIVTVTLVSIGRRVLNRNLKAAKNGSNGKA